MGGMSYDEACADAATRQGLDPVLAILREKRVAHNLEQTGGFTMVVTIPEINGTWAVTADGDRYLVGWYAGESWGSGEDVGDVPMLSTRSLEQIADWGGHSYLS